MQERACTQEESCKNFEKYSTSHSLHSKILIPYISGSGLLYSASGSMNLGCDFPRTRMPSPSSGNSAGTCLSL